MLIRKGLGGLFAVACVCVAAASCSSSSSNNNGSSGDLVSTCDRICSGVSSCIDSSILVDCQNGCSQLGGLEGGGCISDLVDYLACLAGPNISCANGQLQIKFGGCAAQKNTLLSCTANPGLFSGCFVLASNAACASSSLPNGQAEFCIGVPNASTRCVTPNGTANPIGIGTYCCPP